MCESIELEPKFKGVPGPCVNGVGKASIEAENDRDGWFESKFTDKLGL